MFEFWDWLESKTKPACEVKLVQIGDTLAWVYPIALKGCSYLLTQYRTSQWYVSCYLGIEVWRTEAGATPRRDSRTARCSRPWRWPGWQCEDQRSRRHRCGSWGSSSNGSVRANTSQIKVEEGLEVPAASTTTATPSWRRGRLYINRKKKSLSSHNDVVTMLRQWQPFSSFSFFLCQKNKIQSKGTTFSLSLSLSLSHTHTHTQTQTHTHTNTHTHVRLFSLFYGLGPRKVGAFKTNRVERK